MSGSAYVVMPVDVGKDGSRQETAKMASAIQYSVYEQTHPKPPPLPAPPKLEEKGPLKEILAVTVAEFVSRSFGPDTLLSRLRSKPYRKFPERTLNATLKDIHDFTQYSVVQGQKIMFGQDLDKTFAAFLGCTALYWLIQIASPFALSVLALTLLYIAPLAVSLQGRMLATQVAHDSTVVAGDIANNVVNSGKAAIDSGKSLANSAMDRSQAMANATADTSKSAVDKGKSLANDGMAMASGQTAKARDVVVDTSGRVRTTASNVMGFGKQQAQEMKNELECESNYVVDRDHKPHATGPSSIPRASHRALHPSEPVTTEDRRKVHFYSDPLSSRF
ncbi:hypothetical protein B0T14DRAFT_590541 [Immersiella caudata]|uniref:Reticulon domain-containing protein n=1 Tax=Immersiella caudata TaxID=314043 RepID=A0AA39WLN2_9PEZI|nr:hypothetical protein B0T14DRAFT_590541 [Immersiella caudata]